MPPNASKSIQCACPEDYRGKTILVVFTNGTQHIGQLLPRYNPTRIDIRIDLPMTTAGEGRYLDIPVSQTMYDSFVASPESQYDFTLGVPIQLSLGNI